MSRPTRIYVVDNGGQWTHRIWRVLKEIGCDSKIIANTAPVEEI
jgi:GMP synthase (glutamine-hydrolysing)